MEQPEEGKFYAYKGKVYKVIRVVKDTKSQDLEGRWVATVYYVNVPYELLQFVRPVTDFCNKFSRVY